MINADMGSIIKKIQKAASGNNSCEKGARRDAISNKY
jgi:hypothetical protein